MSMIFMLLGIALAFLAGSESGAVSGIWWETLSADVLPYICLSLSFLLLAIVSIAPRKVREVSKGPETNENGEPEETMPTTWRYELLMFGSSVLFGLSLVYAAMHPDNLDRQLFALMAAQGVTLVLITLFFVMKSNKLWRLAIPSLLILIGGAGFLVYVGLV